MLLANVGKLFSIAWFLLLTSCSGTYSTRTGDGDTQGTEVYPITMDDAVLIMQDAMQKEFPEDRIGDVFSPNRGFSAKMRFLADIDTITVYAVKGQGRGPGGQVIDGLVFEVHRSGTYPLGGIPKSKAVLKRVVEGASRLSDALPKI
jgi:hypothetical protein